MVIFLHHDYRTLYKDNNLAITVKTFLNQGRCRWYQGLQHYLENNDDGDVTAYQSNHRLAITRAPPHVRADQSRTNRLVNTKSVTPFRTHRAIETRIAVETDTCFFKTAVFIDSVHSQFLETFGREVCVNTTRRSKKLRTVYGFKKCRGV